MITIKTFRHIAKKVLPDSVFGYFNSQYQYFYEISFSKKIKKTRENYQEVLKDIRQKEKIKVAFLLVNTDIWKYESLYYEFQKEESYEPIVIICPFTVKGPDFLQSELKKSIDYCESNKLNFFLAFDEVKNKPVDINKALDLDLVFLANPNRLSSKEFQVSNFKDKLTCYVPYSFRMDTLYKYNYDSEMVNLTWLNFYETPIHKKLSQQYARNNGENVVVSGFPYLNSFQRHSERDEWKPQNKQKKKIIWGPHWTIKGFQTSGLDWSCFLTFYDTFLQIANEFEDVAQFAFKPHPFLRKTLEKPELWGKDRTQKYFAEWDNRGNCQIVDGGYVDLFIDSDALVHDSGSFLAEYLVINKPVAYTMGERGVSGEFNDFGKEALKCHYLVNNEKELRKFIKNVILEQDELASLRNNFIRTNLVPNDGISSTTKIIQTISNKIKGL